MPIKVTCSNCGGVLHAPDDAGGKRGRCPTCGNVLPIPADGQKVAEGAAEPPPASSKAKQSFGDFAVGGSAAPASRAEVPPAVRSSAANLGDQPADKRRGASYMPPPPDFEKVEAKRPRVPQTRPAAAPNAEVSEGLILAWKRTRGGLWWVCSAVFFALIPMLALPGLVIYKHFAGPLAFIKPAGFIQVKGIGGYDELQLAVVVLPIALSIVCLVFGRLGFTRVPRRAYARGLAVAAAFATFAIFAGMMALLFPPVSLFIVSNGELVWELFDTVGTEGMVQRYGLAAIVTGLILGEFWFASAIGRVGTALEDDRTSARSTRYQFVLGVILAGLIFAGSLRIAYPFESHNGVPAALGTQVKTQWEVNGQPEWNKVGEYKLVAMNGAAVLGALIFGWGYFRMLGATRRAIRTWLENHGAA